MEVMVIYVWQCMVVLLYDCIIMCARWLWSIMNEDATSTNNMKGCKLHDRLWRVHTQKRKRRKRGKEKSKKRKITEEKSVHGRIQTFDHLLVKPALLSTVLLLTC